MVDGSAVSPAASLMELSMQLHGANCVDSFKAVVLGFATVVEGCVQIDILVLEGGGVILDSRLVLEGCEHLGRYSSEAGTTISWWAPGLASLESITELGVWRDTQAWKGWGTLVWVDSAWA